MNCYGCMWLDQAVNGRNGDGFCSKVAESKDYSEEAERKLVSIEEIKLFSKKVRTAANCLLKEALQNGFAMRQNEYVTGNGVRNGTIFLCREENLNENQGKRAVSRIIQNILQRLYRT